MLRLAIASVAVASFSFADDALVFEDQFESGLSDRWEIVGLDESDYRVRDGGLEIRAQSIGWSSEMPMIKFMIDGDLGSSARATVDVKPLGDFEVDGQFAGLFLVDDKSPEFRATKKRVDRNLVFSPGRYTYRGAGPEHENLDAYEVTYPLASDEAGPLNIVVQGGRYATFQVGPAKPDKYQAGRYLNLFHSAIRKSDRRGFALAVGGAPPQSDTWVRFDNFRIERSAD